MKIHFDRRKIESICLLLSFVLIIIMVAMSVFAVADELFAWDLLPDDIEKLAILVMVSIGLVIVAAFLISIMVNFSLISLSLEKLASRHERKSE